MTQKDNILQELKELKSFLVNLSLQNVYSVPAGYFDGLAVQVMKRIKTLEAIDAKEDLNHLSPLLNKHYTLYLPGILKRWQIMCCIQFMKATIIKQLKKNWKFFLHCLAD